MKSIVDWICYVSFVLLFTEVLFYINKDIRNVYSRSVKNVRYRTFENNTDYYENKAVK